MLQGRRCSCGNDWRDSGRHESWLVRRRHSVRDCWARRGLTMPTQRRHKLRDLWRIASGRPVSTIDWWLRVDSASPGIWGAVGGAVLSGFRSSITTLSRAAAVRAITGPTTQRLFGASKHELAGYRPAAAIAAERPAAVEKSIDEVDQLVGTRLLAEQPSAKGNAFASLSWVTALQSNSQSSTRSRVVP